MNQYLEKIAAYTDAVMYMRTSLGKNGAGPTSPAIAAANQRARFAMPASERETIFRRNMLRSAERNLSYGTAKGTPTQSVFQALENATAARKALDSQARTAYGRYSLQNKNGPILNLTDKPIKSHPAMGPTGLTEVKYVGNWPTNPLGVPNKDIDIKTITQKGEVLNKLKADNPRVQQALSTLQNNLANARRKTDEKVQKIWDQASKKLQYAENKANHAVSGSGNMPTAAKAILAGLGLAGVAGTAYAIHQHHSHNQEKRASEEDMNQYLEKIAAWHPDIFKAAHPPAEAWKSLRTITGALKNEDTRHGFSATVSQRLEKARNLEAISKDPSYTTSARESLRDTARKWRQSADRDLPGISPFVPDLRTRG